MVLRPYWGIAGKALMAISLAGALVEFAAITTTDRTHVPLWPLIVCAALFAAGLALFLCRASDPEPTMPSTTPQHSPSSTSQDETPPSYPGREFSDAEPAEIMSVLTGATTDIQANKLLRPYYGKWLRVSGPLENATAWSSGSSLVTFSNFLSIGENRVNAFFNDEHVVEGRLALLRVGTRLTIIGQITDVGRLGITLMHCEIESVASREIKPNTERT